MLFHISFNAHDTDAVAAALAEILGGAVVNSPSPPFDPASRFVCTFDEHGTMIEIGPWGVTWQPGADEQSEVVPVDGAPEHNYFHGLFSSSLSVDQIIAVAHRAGWRAALVDNGPFRVVNVWVENRQLLEFTTAELMPDYLATFGPSNRTTLDGQLREFEQMLARL